MQNWENPSTTAESEPAGIPGQAFQGGEKAQGLAINCAGGDINMTVIYTLALFHHLAHKFWYPADERFKHAWVLSREIDKPKNRRKSEGWAHPGAERTT